MKINTKIKLLIVMIGLILFIVIKYMALPIYVQKDVEEHNKYVINQQSTMTHDLNAILKYKNKYMGNSSNIINLFYNLPLSSVPMSFELFSDDLTVKVNYKEKVQNMNKDEVSKGLIYNSTAAFALIDNLESINYNFIDLKYKVSRDDIQNLYDNNLSELLELDQWKLKVQDKLEDKKYVEDFINILLES